MRRLRLAPVALLLLRPLAAAPLDDALANITSDDAAIRLAALDTIAAAGEPVVVQLVELLRPPGEGDDSHARLALHGLVMRALRPGAEDERLTLATTLAGQLAAKLPPAVKVFVISQLQLIGRSESVPALAAALPEPELGEAACRALQANPTPQALAPLREILPVSGTLRLAVIAALGSRRDVAAVPGLLVEAAKPELEVRLAALEALAEIGDRRAEPVLADAWLRGGVRERSRAAAAYLRLAERLRQDNHEQISDVIYGRLLGMGGDPTLLAAALRGLATTGSVRHVPAMVKLLFGDEPVLRAEAARALAGMPDKKVSPALVEEYRHRGPKDRPELLYVLAGRHDKVAENALEAAATDRVAEVRVTALHQLGRLGDPDQESWLLMAAREGGDRIHPVALGAYLRLAQTRLEAGDRQRASTMFRGALALARTVELRRTALRGLGAVGGDEVLPALRRYLADNEVRDEAVRALAAIALRLAEANSDRAAEALGDALALGPPLDLVGPLVERLKQSGRQVDPARAAGYVTTWWVAGPYPGTDMNRVWPPEEGVQLDQPLKIGDAEAHWVRRQVDDPQGRLDLTAMLEPHENTTAYLYAEVTVDRAQEAVIRTGTDDALRGWLNGQVFVFYGEPRGLRVDQDVSPAHLQAGVNRILLKINQGGGGWAGCLRLTDVDGRGLGFRQRED